MARKEQLLISLHYLDLSVSLEFNNISEDDTIVATVSISFYSDRDQLTRYSFNGDSSENERDDFGWSNYAARYASIDMS